MVEKSNGRRMKLGGSISVALFERRTMKEKELAKVTTADESIISI